MKWNFVTVFIFLISNLYSDSTLALIEEFKKSEDKSSFILNLKNKNQKYLIIKLLEQEGDPSVNKLINKYKNIDIRSYNKDLLYYAIMESDIEFIKEKINNRDLKKPFKGSSEFDIGHPFLLAAYKGNVEVMELLTNSTDLKNFSYNGETPLFYANGKEMVNFLIKSGVPRSFTNEGIKAIDALLDFSYDESILTLLKSGETFSNRDKNALTIKIIMSGCSRVLLHQINQGLNLENKHLEFALKARKNKLELFKIFEKQLKDKLVIPMEYLFNITDAEDFKCFQYIVSNYKFDLSFSPGGKSLIGDAIRKRNVELTTLLIKEGVVLKNDNRDLYYLLVKGESQKLSKAINDKRLFLIEKLLKAKAPIEAGTLEYAEVENDVDFLNRLNKNQNLGPERYKK